MTISKISTRRSEWARSSWDFSQNLGQCSNHECFTTGTLSYSVWSARLCVCCNLSEASRPKCQNVHAYFLSFFLHSSLFPHFLGDILHNLKHECAIQDIECSKWLPCSPFHFPLELGIWGVSTGPFSVTVEQCMNGQSGGGACPHLSAAHSLSLLSIYIFKANDKEMSFLRLLMEGTGDHTSDHAVWISNARTHFSWRSNTTVNTQCRNK